MLSFESDYIEGAHPKILEQLVKTNMEQLSGYGNDRYCESAKEKIRKKCKCDDADIYFLVGGTQTNAIVIDSLLAVYEGVIAAGTGHINSHEAGAIEYTGHKVMALPEENGKISADVLQAYIREFREDENHEHMVFPGMVYISHPTEYGTLYSKKELRDISQVCRTQGLYLYMDGARLGYGLMSRETDVTLEDIAQLCDVFYIGGTKMGALCGEAVVFTKKNAPRHFITMIKQRGALLAKGRLLGIQFDTLFTDDLYFRLGRNAIDRAEELRQVFREKGYNFYIDSPTNQQFVVLENSEMEELKKNVSFCFWEKVDEAHTAVRFATSWATRKEDITRLKEMLRDQC